jgi:uncharacterized membrane protein YedE/YeeE
MKIIISMVAGLIFGLGLIISGMTDPAKVIGFLDITGAWDPSLALVMAGAIAVAIIPFQIAKKRSTALLGMPMQLPTQQNINKRLVIGAILFGMGWGIAGICPGPAVVLLGTGMIEAVVFCVAMLLGMAFVLFFLKKNCEL